MLDTVELPTIAPLWRNGTAALVYFAVSLLSFRAAALAALRRHKLDKIFWNLSGLLLAAFSLYELFDLQALLTEYARRCAQAWDLYGRHRILQFYFVILVVVLSVAIGIGSAWLSRRSPISVRVALVGLVTICLFAILRAVSFEGSDAIFGIGWRMFNIGSIQEMASTCTVAAAAWRYARKGHRSAVSIPPPSSHS